MTILYLVRHGEVENPDDILYMRLPGFPLSKKGRKQIKIQGERLKKKAGRDRGVAAIYHSPLLRTAQTAEILEEVLQTGKLIREPRMVDVKTPLEGKITFEEFFKKYDGFMYRPELIQRGGEAIEDIWQRMSEAVREILGKFEGKSVVVASHGDPIQITKLGFQGIDVQRVALRVLHGENFPQKGSVTVLNFGEKGLDEVGYWPPR